MPSPFTKYQANVSKRPPDRPEPIEPKVETYAGVNNPYRGIEQHGVEPTGKPIVPADWEDGRPVEYHVPKEPEPPIPVRIVTEASHELRKMRTYGSLTGTNVGNPRQIVAMDEERSTVQIKHIVSSAVVWISHSAATCNALEGFPLQTGDTYSTDAQTEIYAWADSATPLAVYVSISYAVGV